jgi:hypothetical protein
MKLRSLVAALAALSSVGVSAQTTRSMSVAAAADWKPSISLSAPQPAFKPYVVDWGARPSVDRQAAPRPTVVCGMTLVPADPTFDPQMKVTVPDRGVAYSMRTVPPTVCKTP